MLDQDGVHRFSSQSTFDANLHHVWEVRVHLLRRLSSLTLPRFYRPRISVQSQQRREGVMIERGPLTRDASVQIKRRWM
jgi:hypothetical protein